MMSQLMQYGRVDLNLKFVINTDIMHETSQKIFSYSVLSTLVQL